MIQKLKSVFNNIDTANWVNEMSQIKSYEISTIVTVPSNLQKRL